MDVNPDLKDAPQILFGRVMHKRLFPKVNAFNYGIYYISVPLSKIDQLKSCGWFFGVNRFNVLSFFEKDHGAKDGGDLKHWVQEILAQYDVNADGETTLICMPRVFGYVFNPVSFWLCHNKDGEIKAVICEVNNTFGEAHCYVCLPPKEKAISKKMWIEGEKVFHVSPFLKREGCYKFLFDFESIQPHVQIDFFNEKARKQLITALYGTWKPYTKTNMRAAFFKYPLVTFKAIALIHWQAVKLIAKGIRYISKPVQRADRVSRADKQSLTKN